MTFRQFLEQGTRATPNGLNAAGRAGQSQWTPERLKGPLPTPNPPKNTFRGPKAKKFNPPPPPKIGKL
jgi:hypothetical protein